MLYYAETASGYRLERVLRGLKVLKWLRFYAFSASPADRLNKFLRLLKVLRFLEAVLNCVSWHGFLVYKGSKVRMFIGSGFGVRGYYQLLTAYC